MKSESAQEKIWHDLFCRAADGSLTPEQSESLLKALRDSQKARRRWFEFQDLESGLREIPLVPHEATFPAAPIEPLPFPQTSPGPRRKIIRWSALAAAIALALGATSQWGPLAFNRTSQQQMAQFGSLTGAIWSLPENAFSEGDSVPARYPLELLSGSAEVRFRSGAVATLYAPCIFEVTSGNAGFLTYGKLKAKVATAASKGFTVQTPTARLVDLGTEFLAAAAGDGESRVEVLSGEVRVHLPDAEESRRLAEGESLVLQPREQRVIVKIEDGDGTSEFRFPSIEPPSRRDHAQFTSGKTTGRVCRDHHHPDLSAAEPVSVQNSEHGMVLADLGQQVAVTKVNAYSWHRGEAAQDASQHAAQRFTLYASAAEKAPSTQGVLESNGWDLIGKINSDNYFGVDGPEDRPEQQASSFIAPSGCIGHYRYLLWVPLSPENRDSLALQSKLSKNTPVLSEFDVYTSR
jgi:hypothetical protein